MVQKAALKQNVQATLEIELAKLKKIISFEDVLAVRWNPKPNCKLSGELMGDTIHVYDENSHEAISTLKHEYIDCLLTRKLIEPLIAIVNAFIRLKAREIYREKEHIVNNLLKLIDDTPQAGG